MDDDYSEKSIQVLEGTEGVRKRPAMYIGDVGFRGLHHLVYEVIDNSIDEAMAGRCSKVDVVIHEDNSISLRDDGAGIPAGMHPQYQVPTLELILTRLHSGGKFEKKAYQVSGGLHGIGLAAVCALSEYFRVESYRNGTLYTQEYAKGKKATEVQEEPSQEESGTLIHFKPDPEIFTETVFDFATLSNRFRELAFLTSHFRINFSDTRKEFREKADPEEKYLPGEVNEEGIRTVSYYYEGGLQQFVEYLTKDKEDLIEDSPVFYHSEEQDGVIVEASFKYTAAYSETILGYVNNINTHEGGTHITGLRTVLTRVVNKFGNEIGAIKEDEKNLSGNDVREGIAAVISVKVPEPQFEGQTKTKLGNSEVDGIVQQALGEALEDFLVINDRLGKSIIEKGKLARKAREAAKKARDREREKGKGRVSLPGKLKKSRETDPTKRELFIVEGQSAGGTAIEGRDSGYQEILFMRGKVLNVEKSRIDRALRNNEINNIITAVGTDYLDDFDISRLRYGKIILLTDADVDGAHIATLLFTFFYRYLRPVIEQGYLYIARPPLYKVTPKGNPAKTFIKAKYNADHVYIHKEPELDKLMREADKNENIDPSNFTINRFKGLGEMNADQLKETAMDPATRTIERVTIDDAIESEEWLIKLMGDDVSARKEFIRHGVFDEDNSNQGLFYKVAFKDAEIEDLDDDDIDPEELSIKQDIGIDNDDDEDLEDHTGKELIDALEGLDLF